MPFVGRITGSMAGSVAMRGIVQVQNLFVYISSRGATGYPGIVVHGNAKDSDAAINSMG